MDGLLDADRLPESAARRSPGTGGLLEDVPEDLPALEQAQRISVRAAGAGFEWEDVAGVLDKLEEELAEWRQARAEQPDGAHAQEELGDVLFTVVQLARWDGYSAEDALAGVCRKFRARWAIMETLALEQTGQADLSQLPAAELEDLWGRAKAFLGKERT